MALGVPVLKHFRVSQFPLRIWSVVLLQVHVLAVLFYFGRKKLDGSRFVSVYTNK